MLLLLLLYVCACVCVCVCELGSAYLFLKAVQSKLPPRQGCSELARVSTLTYTVVVYLCM
jgi:hypothetical protein